MKTYKGVLFFASNSKLEHPDCGQELVWIFWDRG